MSMNLTSPKTRCILLPSLKTAVLTQHRQTARQTEREIIYAIAIISYTARSIAASCGVVDLYENWWWRKSTRRSVDDSSQQSSRSHDRCVLCGMCVCGGRIYTELISIFPTCFSFERSPVCNILNMLLGFSVIDVDD